MKVWLSPYTLELEKKSPPHISTEGALIKFQDEEKENQISYSLYHPIKSLGDLSLEELSSSFKETVLNPESSWHSIYTRSINPNEENEVIDLEMYELCSDLELLKDCIADTVKLKIKNLSDLKKALEVKTDKTLILDCNGQLSINDFEQLTDEEKKSILKNIKYIEDPYKEFDQKKPPYLKVASDFHIYQNYDYKILKPTAFAHPLEVSKEKKNVVTSYLDHPFGLIIAGLWAVKNKIDEPCGLGTLNFFKSDDYSELIEAKNIFRFNKYPELFKLLEAESWSRLI